MRQIEVAVPASAFARPREKAVLDELAKRADRAADEKGKGGILENGRFGCKVLDILLILLRRHIHEESLLLS